MTSAGGSYISFLTIVRQLLSPIWSAAPTAFLWSQRQLCADSRNQWFFAFLLFELSWLFLYNAFALNWKIVCFSNKCANSDVPFRTITIFVLLDWTFACVGNMLWNTTFGNVFRVALACVSTKLQNNMRISRTRVQVVELLQYLLGANSSKNAYFSNTCVYYKSMRFACVFNKMHAPKKSTYFSNTCAKKSTNQFLATITFTFLREIRRFCAPLKRVGRFS